MDNTQTRNPIPQQQDAQRDEEKKVGDYQVTESNRNWRKNINVYDRGRQDKDDQDCKLGPQPRNDEVHQACNRGEQQEGWHPHTGQAEQQPDNANHNDVQGYRQRIRSFVIHRSLSFL